MLTHARAAILSIGDELTLGQALDTNSQWLSRQLLDRGILPVEHATVADDREAIALTIMRLARGDGSPADARDLVICTGGLGPTADDLTRHALADALAEAIVEDAEAVRAIEAWFAGRGRAMPEINRVQALRPSSARMLPNSNGTAPGLAARLHTPEADIFCLPGPPREMTAMFETHVASVLRPTEDRIVLTRSIATFGLGESDIAQCLGPLMDRDRNPKVGTTASGGHVACRLRFESAIQSQSSARRDQGTCALDEAEARIRDLLGPYVLGLGELSVTRVLVELLRERQQSLAVAESCTGGMLGSHITDVPGASPVFPGGVITYSNAQKQQLLGVPAVVLSGPGAVSLECAQAMAVGCLGRMGTDHTIAITGIAGPEGGSIEKPVGTVWIAIASRAGDVADVQCRRFLLGPDRASIREWSARLGAAMLRLQLVGQADAPLLRERECRSLAAIPIMNAR